MTGAHKDIRYYDDGSTDESVGYSEEGGSQENIKDIRKMSSQSEGSQKDQIEDDLNKRENLIASTCDNEITCMQSRISPLRNSSSHTPISYLYK